MKKSKFKIGDKVRCIGISSGYDSDDNLSYGGAGWQQGKIFEIYDISYFDVRGEQCYWEKYKDYGVWESHLELVNKEVKKYGITLFLESIEK